MVKACFVILHYGEIFVTESCIASILKMDSIENIRIIVVDNDTQKSDEKRQELKIKYKDCPQVQVLQMQEECGFSKANNAGYQYARSHYEPEYMVICNNDIEFQQGGFLYRLEQIYKETEFAVYGPDVIKAGNGEHQNPMDSRIRTLEEVDYTIRMNRLGLKYYSLVYPLLYLQQKNAEKKKLKGKEENIEWYRTRQEGIVPFGACLIFSKDFIQNEKKAFEPETQFYYEEYILTKRCQEKKYKIIYDPTVQVLHESGAATKRTFGSMKKQMKFRMERTLEAAEIYKKEVEK